MVKQNSKCQRGKLYKNSFFFGRPATYTTHDQKQIWTWISYIVVYLVKGGDIMLSIKSNYFDKMLVKYIIGMFLF